MGVAVRPGAEGLDRVLSGDHAVTYTARALREWDRETIPVVPIVNGRLNFDSTRQVCGSGSATLAFADVSGRSHEPKHVNDPLSPYGNWLEVTCHVRSGRFHSATVLGKFEITKPQAQDRGFANVGGVRRTTAETITVRLDDAFAGTLREPISDVMQSTVGRSISSELADLLGLPVRVERNAYVSALVEYPENRLEAVFDLVKLVGGEPYMRWDGSVGIRPDEWPAPSFSLHDGAFASAPGVTVGSIQVDEWDSDDVPNRVVVIAETPDQRTLIAENRIRSGPLRYGPRVEGAWGRRTKTYKVGSFTEQVQVDRHLAERFAADTTPRAVGLSIEMPVDPRLEPGDVGQLWSETISARIRIKAVDIDMASPTMKVSAYLA
ncbi:hypothetical protein [Rathayibacter sp. AY1B8]|uniref:hypothetical protein n=1 Tax=Rathayibacter sp. AY1B8 TaxID=2080533 RepID=UPI000CE8006E|nr:hypothetical protein [Rathayibacter sp. AY1B8]PPI08237.1 hypothetical protein C5C63_04590 [Rathayibacter sp. AY1B8]